MVVHVVIREVRSGRVGRSDVEADSLEAGIEQVSSRLPDGWVVLYAVAIEPEIEHMLSSTDDAST